MFSENSYGVCVPVNSSANEIIVGMARASALQNSGSNGKAKASPLPKKPRQPSPADARESARLSMPCQNTAWQFQQREEWSRVFVAMRALP